MLKVFFLPFFVIFFAICLLAFDALSDLVMIHVVPETPVRLFFHVKGALIGMVCYYTWSIWLEWMIDTHFKFETFLVAVIELRMEASLWWSIKYIQFTSIKIEQQRKSSKKYFTQNPSSHTTASKSKSRKGKSAKKCPKDQNTPWSLIHLSLNTNKHRLHFQFLYTHVNELPNSGFWALFAKQFDPKMITIFN